MGQIFKHAEKYSGIIRQGTIFVEIGSDRWEGSTECLADLAQKHNTKLHTVDINTTAQQRITHSAIEWHVAIGSEWCKDYKKHIGQPIGLVYLDNFDYDWDTACLNPMIQQQKASYMQDHGIIMNNQNCQIEHMRQIIGLTPWLDKQCVVIFDDTYRYNDCWIGKSGPVVVYLLAMGFKITQADEHEFGVILTRG